MAKKRRKTKKRARHRLAMADGARPATERPDKRSIFTEVTAIGGVPVAEPHLLMAIQPIELESGDILMFQSPLVPVLYLLKAKALRDQAEPKRVAALTQTHREADSTLRPHNAAQAFDALEDLTLSVVLSMAAIEAYANEAIARLPNDAMVETHQRLAGKTVAVLRDRTVMDWLNLPDKLSRAVPILTGQHIKGTKAWQDFRHIRRLRNDLAHARREVLNDPKKPGVFGRLMLGEASSVPENAARVIEALEPGWVPEHVRTELGLPALERRAD